MPEFADIWSHFFWRFLHTIFKSVIKHSRITMQKKAITIGKPHYHPQICKLESTRSQQKERACILNVLLFNIQALFRFCDYSNSWAERFIWLFLGAHLCILFFIFILFLIFCTSSKIFRAKMEPNILLKIYVIIMNSHIKNT